MSRIGARVSVLAACLLAAGCTIYNPATGQYQPDPMGTSLLAGGLGMAGGVALGAALADHDDCCWGGGYNSNVYVHNNYNYNRTSTTTRTPTTTGRTITGRTTVVGRAAGTVVAEAAVGVATVSGAERGTSS
jgi:hypothetical protein